MEWETTTVNADCNSGSTQRGADEGKTGVKAVERARKNMARISHKKVERDGRGDKFV